MRRRGQVLMAGAAAAVLLASGCAHAAPTARTARPRTTPVASPAAAAGASGYWGRAITVPGLGALNRGGNAEVGSVSCSSRGYCAAVGFYTDSGGHQQAFVVGEQNGSWGKETTVPGIAVESVQSVSCASASRCVAGGSYVVAGPGHRLQGFVTGPGSRRTVPRPDRLR